MKDLFSHALEEQVNGNYLIAINLYNKCIENNLNLVQSYNNLGLIYFNLKKFNESETCLKKSVKYDELFIDAHNNLYVLYNSLKKFDLAIFHANICLKINPNNPNILTNLGNFYSSHNNITKAKEYYLKSIKLDSKNILTINNLASLEFDLGNTDLSIKYYTEAIKLDESWFLAKKNIGISYLKIKKFKEGFNNFEYRKNDVSKNEYANKPNNLKLWGGENLNKKILLLYSEGGFGDMIHFARYIKDLKESYDVKIYLDINKKIQHLFENLDILFLNDTSAIPEHNYFSYVMSLPKIHYEKHSKILNQNYEILTKNNLSIDLQKKIDKIKFPRIGICWHGNENNKSDIHRSISLNYMLEIFELKKISFISLQEKIELEELKVIEGIENFTHFDDALDKNKAFEDTIEIIKNIDLVITCDTAIAHLSAPLNKETWILLSTASDWRWFAKDTKSPWYSNVKLFRQDAFNQWKNVILKVKKELHDRFNH